MTDKSRKKALGERIKSMRIACGYTQKALAEKLGKSESAVRMWELGKSAPTIFDIAKLAKFLNTSIDAIAPSEKEA